MPDFILEDSVYTSRWKRAFLWNFFLLGVLTPFFVILGYHMSLQQNPVTQLKGKAYKSGGIASFLAVVGTYLLLAIATPMVTGMSLGQAARLGAETTGRGCRAAGEWIGAFWKKAPENSAARDAEKARGETEAREKDEAGERLRVLAGQRAAEERVANELEQKRRQAEAAIVAPRETAPRNEHALEEQQELARFEAEQKRRKSDQDARVDAQAAKVAAQAALDQCEQADLSLRKAKATLRASEGELSAAQRRIANLDAQQPRPANYAQLRRLYHEAGENAKQRVAEVRSTVTSAEREFARAQSAVGSTKAKADSFGNIGLSKPAAKPPPEAVISIYCLKDGREINTVKVVDLGDSYGLKDETGRVTTVKKTEVWDIRDP